MKNYILLLGSNIGDKRYYLSKSIELISKNIGYVDLMSKIYKTEPWGFESDNYFLNMAISVKSKLTPNIFLEKVLSIEKKLGRERKNKTGYLSRTIDIDIIFIDNLVLKTKNLEVPHPRMNERKFVLKPLSDIIPNFIHPIKNNDIKKILLDCEDNLKIAIFEENLT